MFVMGNDQSKSRDGYAFPDVSDADVPVQYVRMNQDQNDQKLRDITDCVDEENLSYARNITKLFNPPFFGVWSIVTPNMIGPHARSGHFTVVDDDEQVAYIGYGTSSCGEQLVDLWCLNLNNFCWREIKLIGNDATPRNGARAVLVHSPIKRLFVFCGYINRSYTNSFQAIDIDTGIVTDIQTYGNIPDRRSTPVMQCNNNKIYMWGGYNGSWPNELHVLDLDTFEWSTFPCNEKGRTSIPSILYKNHILSYGGSHSEGILTIDTLIPAVKILPTTGFPPPCEIMSSGMVRSDNLLFYFGGKSKDSNWTVLYAYDIEKRWWFIFHVRPDGETVTLSDGNVSENGIFMLPRVHSFGVAYSRNRRTIVAFLGLPFTDPPNLFMINIGEALGFINLRSDMGEALLLTQF
ncbi:Kelch motif family protein [Tritrichomonas foetus]|uniref:Kelch motif family protein n=1 Tax=Tritrichomonas foetus TaxID=1144522 RepID=A0A1J4KBC8_9EUKA|nr:Kelch motif family protein [Tritrichomonas foetus]|eukprot:OHT06998.1 Kelch motif family protein [Tritrichomonas foetus]